MSESLKDDVLNAILIANMFDEVENGICSNDSAEHKINWSELAKLPDKYLIKILKHNSNKSNDPANQKVDWSKTGMQMLDNFKEVHLYNVQFKIDTHKSVRLVNKFVYAYDRDDAINLVIKKYQNFKVDIDDIYCQRVDTRRGMMFSNN